jgi:outer membrane biosynthesis protein TonB
MRTPNSVAICILLGLTFLVWSGMHSASAQSQKNNCKRPPKILSQPRFSDEAKTKWKGKTISGKVAIVVSEDGDVVQARIVSASPKESAEALLNAARKAKFQARTGCGELKTEVILNLDR